MKTSMKGAMAGTGGTIRPVDTRCELCGKPFELVNERAGYCCPNHLTKPSRFMLDLWVGADGSRERVRLYTNQHSQVLEGYRQARDLQDAVTHDILANKFDIRKYKKEDPKTYYLENCWEIYKAEHANPGTLILIELSQNDTLNYFTPSKDFRTLTQDDVKDLNAELKKRMKANSALIRIRYFLACIRCCEEKMKIPSLGLKTPKIPKNELPQKARVPSRDIARRIANAITNPYCRWAAQINQAQGIRPSDTVCLKVGDINFETGMIEIRRHETQKGLILPGTKSNPQGHDSLINQSLIEPLRRYCAGKHPDEWLCPTRSGKRMRAKTLEDHLRRAARSLGFDYKPYTILKHSTLTHAAGKTGNAIGIAAISGITPETALRNYIIPNQDAAKAVQDTITFESDEIQPP